MEEKLTAALCRPLPAGSAARAARPPAGGLLAAGHLLSAPPGGPGRGQRGGQGEGSRHRQQTAPPAAAGGGRPERAAGETGRSAQQILCLGSISNSPLRYFFLYNFLLKFPGKYCY